ncbi:MAG: DUF4169 family protein [Rhizobiales bacterium]|nr:DUF4169 family protein [Hyphomicrobiales bacterium]MBO6697665.1 DUF4169 family protein [Hyphomicrobiales bacterium]MBO6736080.1 DUF4169 family protein [Hyphomicrobiales bacterium]MBO6912550.1 DUF4169 family protein [Hyphomicrobiales bacterium]MBO6956942.1 DUF4169 family protein [Hyphomicrobiales bacterium]
MAEIVNLRQARKAKARSQKEKVAETNRALHGRTKAEKQVEKSTKHKVAKHLDDHKLGD